MKILNLTAENIKKLVAVEITPDGNIVQITGKNGQGKTSFRTGRFWTTKASPKLPTWQKIRTIRSGSSAWTAAAR